MKVAQPETLLKEIVRVTMTKFEFNLELYLCQQQV